MTSQSGSPIFNRKGYEKVAEVLHARLESSDWSEWIDLVSDFAEMFEADNPAFDRLKFVEAATRGNPPSQG